MNDLLKAEVAPMGWTAKCPYCDLYFHLTSEADHPSGEYTCDGCGKDFEVEE